MKREVELGSHSELDCLLLPVLTAVVSDSVFVTVQHRCLTEEQVEKSV